MENKFLGKSSIPKVNKTYLFKDYDAFLNRKDRDVNGVSTQFANKYPNWKEMNTTNTGCWNCVDCKECENCVCCTECVGCEMCTECVGCVRCTECVECEECEDCRECLKCKKCKECRECEECEECEDCREAVGAREKKNIWGEVAVQEEKNKKKGENVDLVEKEFEKVEKAIETKFHWLLWGMLVLWFIMAAVICFLLLDYGYVGAFKSHGAFIYTGIGTFLILGTVWGVIFTRKEKLAIKQKELFIKYIKQDI